MSSLNMVFANNERRNPFRGELVECVTMGGHPNEEKENIFVSMEYMLDDIEDIVGDIPK